jgi:hypothetical protein
VVHFLDLLEVLPCCSSLRPDRVRVDWPLVRILFLILIGGGLGIARGVLLEAVRVIYWFFLGRRLLLNRGLDLGHRRGLLACLAHRGELLAHSLAGTDQFGSFWRGFHWALGLRLAH